MKIRHRITLWVALAGFLTSLVFSLVVFLEMIEQPYELLDSELEAAAAAVAGRLAKEQSEEPAPAKAFSIQGDRYWIKVYNQNRRLVYQSDLSSVVDLPLHNEGDDGYTVRTHIPDDRAHLNQDMGGEIAFRVRVISAGSNGISYVIQIAKSMEKLDDEISDVWIILGIGLVVSTVLLVIISYGFAGRIVRPVAEINRLSKEINERTLETRIPLGKSRDELYGLSSSLNRMFDRLQYSFKKQKEFLASASHELKTPTAILRLFFDEAVQRQDLPASLQQQLMTQGDMVLRMERLVKKLLELSVLELKDSVEWEEFSLTDLLNSVLEDFSAIMAAKKIQIQVHVPEGLRVMGDKDQIRRMLINIIDNAVKYNFEKGQIRFEANEDKDGVHLFIFNSGPGIPQDDLEKVFEQFYRVEKSRSLQYGGSGLGLAIVKEIVRLHRGKVTMESTPGAWARIRITLPKDRS